MKKPTEIFSSDVPLHLEDECMLSSTSLEVLNSVLNKTKENDAFRIYKVDEKLVN